MEMIWSINWQNGMNREYILYLSKSQVMPYSNGIHALSILLSQLVSTLTNFGDKVTILSLFVTDEIHHLILEQVGGQYYVLPSRPCT